MPYPHPAYRSTLRSAQGTAVVLAIAAALGACGPLQEPTPEGQITHVVVVLDSAGMEQTYYADPDATDAIFLSEAARDAWYAGTGGRRPEQRSAMLTADEDSAGAVLGPCFHCVKMTCYCMCIRPVPGDSGTVERIGVIIRADDGSRLWWVRADQAGALFLTDSAAAQYTSGTPIAPGHGTESPLLTTDSAAATLSYARLAW